MPRASNCLPLLGSVVGGAVGARILISYRMSSFVKQTDSNTSLKSNELPRRLPKFLVLHNEDVSAHASLNYTRGVMSSDEFLMVTDSEFVSELEAQKVIAARRITLKRDGQIIPTCHVILTFDTPVLPKRITAGYISCDIRPYIQNPVRCQTSNVNDLGTLKLPAVDPLLSVPAVLSRDTKKHFVKIRKNVLIVREIMLPTQ
ncbi:hypothetical protein AVEN_68088-1 [Araneus ventricosus]|uniref:Uncharacterized protein n=1 Tax=Araneus ventricosus TaxID=182803 RepID=A0A4Y2NZW3_ARAVE|nr:hypothetical protein AVEN_68088-1 [Araneus ventricosus]